MTPVENARALSAPQLEAVAELALYALHDVELPLLLDRTAALAARLLGAAHAAIAARDPIVGALRVEAWAGKGDDLLPEARAAMLVQAGYVLELGEPVVCDAMAAEARVAAAPVVEAGARGCAGVLIHGKERPFGVLIAVAEQPGAPGNNDVAVLQALAGVLTLAIERMVGEARQRELAAIVDLSSEALIGVSLDGKITTWNAAAEALYGFSAGEIVGQNLDIVLPADRMIEPMDLLRRLEQGEHITNYETLRVGKHGRHIPVALNISPIVDRSGTLVGAAASSRDLSVVERAEEVEVLNKVSTALSGVLEPSRLYRIILEQAARMVRCEHAILVVYLDDWAVIAACWGEPSLPEGTQFYPLSGPDRPWHPPVSAMPTYLPDTDLEPSWQDIPPWVGDKRIRSIISAPLNVEGELVGSFDIGSGTPNRYTDRDLRLATVFAERVAHAMRNARRFEAEQHRAQQLASLQELTAGLSAAHTPAEVAKLVLERGCAMLGAVVGAVRLISADGAWLEVLETIGPEPQGMSLTERVPLDASFASTDAARSGRPVWLGSTSEWQRRYPSSAGPYRASGQVAAAALPLKSGTRTFGSLVLTFPEPHSFNAADRHFIQSLAELTAQALERSRHFEAERERAILAEEMARVSQEQANEAEALARLSSELVATVSHELRNPINTILGFAEILKHALPGGDADSPVEQLNMIVSAASRQQRLVKDLLLLSKLDLGVLNAEIQVLDLGRHVRQAVTELRGNYRDQQVIMQGPVDLRVIGDGGRVLQILINLLDNAVRHSPDGSTIEVNWQAEGMAAVVRVTDHGTGVAVEGRERLFTRFGKLSSGKARGGGSGSGLGLYLSRRFAEAMGGTLDLEHTGPGGSTFRLRLAQAPASV